MAKQHAQKPRQIPPIVDTSIAIADVPVKIAFIQGDVTLHAYEGVSPMHLLQKLQQCGNLENAWLS